MITKLDKKKIINSEELKKQSKANDLLQIKLKLIDTQKSEKLEQFEKEIFKLGNVIFRMQEKYDLYVKKSEEKINKLVSESVHRAQINASPEIRKYVNESLSSRDKKEKNLTGIASNKNQNSRHIKGNSLNLNSTIEFNKTIEDQKQHIEYLNETYTVQLDKLSQELADIRESYRSLEIELLKTQENLKNSEENRIISIKSSEHLINEHKQEIKIIKDTLEKEQINLSHLKNENLKLKTEILENSQLEILKKYTKVVLELKNKPITY